MNIITHFCPAKKPPSGGFLLNFLIFAKAWDNITKKPVNYIIGMPPIPGFIA